MKKYNFIKIAGSVLVSFLLLGCNNNDKSVELPRLRNLELHVGATEPFSALHISDSHLALANENDNERKQELSAKRQEAAYSNALKFFLAEIDYARKNNMLILHTGDMYDFVSDENHSLVKTNIDKEICFASAGNHEFSQYVGEAREDAAYKALSYPDVQAIWPNDLTFASKIVNGVNFVAVDNVYYNFTYEQLDLMKKEVEKGLPIVMLCHVPIYTEEQCAFNQKGDTSKAAYLVGAPREVTDAYDAGKTFPEGEQWRNRAVQQRTDEATAAFIDWLKQQPLVKVILCGHTHQFFENRISQYTMQYTVGAGYKGAVYAIQFK